MKFSELQNILKEKFGIDHLADIARELEVSPQAVSNWKSRDKVPYKYIVKIRKQIEVSEKDFAKNIEQDNSNLIQDIPQSGNFEAIDEDSISLSDIMLVLARQLKIIIIVPTVFCILAIFYALFIAKPVYESSVKILSVVGSGSFQPASGLAAQFGISFPTVQSQPTQWVYEDIIRSRTFAKVMLKRKFDTEKFGKQKPLLQILTYGNDEPTVGIDTLMKGAFNQINSMFEISKGTGFYTITTRAFEPLFARDIAVALVEELDSHQRKYNKSKTSETRKFIEERIAEKEKELNYAEEELKNFRDRNRRMGNSPALLLEQQRLSREVAVLTGVFTTLKQQLETTKIEEVKDSDYVVVLDPPESPLLRSKPQRRRIVVVAGVLGIGIGILFGFINEYFNNRNIDEWEKIGQARSLLIKNIFDLLPRRFKKV